MKSDGALLGMVLLLLILAVGSSTVVWAEITSAVKLGMFAFGFGSGVAVGTLIARRSK